MKTAEHQKAYNNVVGIDGNPVRIKTARAIGNSHDPLNDAILGELLGQTTKTLNESAYQEKQEIEKNARKPDYVIRVEIETIKRVCLGIGSFVMFCGLLKVTVPFVTEKLSKPVLQPQAVKVLPPASTPLPPLQQDPTAKRMQKLEHKIDRLETIITHVADEAESRQAARPVIKRVIVAKRVAVAHRAVKRAPRPVITKKKDDVPVIIYTDQPQAEKLF